ncbi:hypothetical protein ACIBG0_07380 [Nocardia sp. NPDC050630]|uniref:hypothetical protein n=1 Tax=Nocardia sp. NPDC050630 TaxID=3364321 RepID=UPI003790485E
MEDNRYLAEADDETVREMRRRIALAPPALGLMLPVVWKGSNGNAAEPLTVEFPTIADRSPGPGTTIHGLADLNWQPAPGAPPHSFETADVLGSHRGPGFYASYARWYPGWMSAPHAYTFDRHAVMLSGVWTVGAGPTIDLTTTAPMYPGEFATRTAGTPHYDGTLSDSPEPAVFILFGIGPAIPIPVDPARPLFVRI